MGGAVGIGEITRRLLPRHGGLSFLKEGAQAGLIGGEGFGAPARLRVGGFGGDSGAAKGFGGLVDPDEQRAGLGGGAAALPGRFGGRNFPAQLRGQRLIQLEQLRAAGDGLGGQSARLRVHFLRALLSKANAVLVGRALGGGMGRGMRPGAAHGARLALAQRARQPRGLRAHERVEGRVRLGPGRVRIGLGRAVVRLGTARLFAQRRQTLQRFRGPGQHLRPGAPGGGLRLSRFGSAQRALRLGAALLRLLQRLACLRHPAAQGLGAPERLIGPAEPVDARAQGGQRLPVRVGGRQRRLGRVQLGGGSAQPRALLVQPPAAGHALLADARRLLFEFRGSAGALGGVPLHGQRAHGFALRLGLGQLRPGLGKAAQTVVDHSAGVQPLLRGLPVRLGAENLRVQRVEFFRVGLAQRRQQRRGLVRAVGRGGKRLQRLRVGAAAVQPQFLEELCIADEGLLPGGALFAPSLLQRSAQAAVGLRAEHLLEDALALVAFGVENAQKIALGDHHRLAELLFVQPQQRRHRLRHLPRAQPLAAVVQTGHLRVVLLRGFQPLAQIGGIAMDEIGLAQMGKGQLREGRGFRVGEMAAEGRGIAPRVAAAGRAVEGEGHAVEQRGLARAGVAGDEKQAAQPGKIHLGGLAVGPEGAQLQSNRSHRFSPPSRRISRITSSCASVGARPF